TCHSIFKLRSEFILRCRTLTPTAASTILSTSHHPREHDQRRADEYRNNGSRRVLAPRKSDLLRDTGRAPCTGVGRLRLEPGSRNSPLSTFSEPKQQCRRSLANGTAPG